MASGPEEPSVSPVLEAEEGIFQHSHLNFWDEDSGEPPQAVEVEALGLGTGNFHLNKSSGNPYAC